MSKVRTRGFILFFLRAYPRRTAFLVFLLALAGLSEVLGVATMLPLLELAISSGGQPSSLSIFVQEALNWIGLNAGLGTLLCVIIVGMVLKGVFRLFAMKQVGATVAQVATDLRLALIEALLRTRWSYFISQPSGRFSNAINSEAARAAASYRSLCSVVASAIQALVYLGLAFLVSWQVAILAVFAGLLVVAVLGRLVEVSRRAGLEQTESTRSLINRLTDALQGIKPIKAMGLEERLRPHLVKETNKINRSIERQVLASEAIMAAQEPILVIVLSAGLYGALSFGSQPFTELLVMAFIFNRLAGRISLLQTDYQTLVVGESAYWSMRENIDTALAVAETLTGTRPVPALSHGIRVDSVSFSYPGRRVLDRATVAVPAGEMVAFSGPSGAGKTTLADLIAGLQQPSSGEIYLDGVPLSEIDHSAWRKSIGYVPQEMFLFHDTLYQNISFDDPAIDRTAVREALIQAGAWEFVEHLPHGLDTIMGERGARLSGGQRQRIAIARALARRPKLLVLDEITASLDSATEAAICETLRSLRGTVTIVAISHQPALLEASDRVYWLENGTATLKMVSANDGLAAAVAKA